MQKFMNAAADFVPDVLEGIYRAHPGLRAGTGYRTVVRSEPVPSGRVAVVTGGGSGHLPLFLGYVGDGLVDGAAVGEIFASPSAEQILSVIEECDRGAGVLLLFGNYSGDSMNFALAARQAAERGIRTTIVKSVDDVTSAPADARERRRGVAGLTLLYRIAGAAARRGADLDEVARVTQHAVARLGTVGVALAPCTLPTTGRPTFELPAGEMEIGMGIHGEPGVRRAPLASARDIVDALLDLILADLAPARGSEVGVLVNGLGATPPEELYILLAAAADRLDREGIALGPVWLGEYATSLEMAGASISLLVLDDELRSLVTEPVAAPVLGRA
jgi:dihydroxyacetone kinase